jgi:hypothetical protein
MVLNVAAPTVKTMSSCRATSFYLAPGVLRYFKDHTLVAVLSDGTWIEILHRRDVARLRADRTDWNGTVLCCGLGGADALRTALLDTPEKVERWVIDERVVEGRRPNGPQHPLHRLHYADVSAIGGGMQSVQSILPGANKPLRRVALDLLERCDSRAAHRLSLANALQGVVPDDVIARALEKHTLLDAAGWAPVEVQRFRQNFLEATAQFPGRRSMIAESLLDGSAMSLQEKIAVLKSSLEVSPLILQAELTKVSGGDLTRMCSARQLDVETLEMLMQQLDKHSQLQLLSQPALPRETVDKLIAESREFVELGLSNVAGNPYAEQRLLTEMLRDERKFQLDEDITEETQMWLLNEVVATSGGMSALQQHSTAYGAVRALARSEYLDHATALSLLEHIQSCEEGVRDNIFLALAENRGNNKDLQIALIATGRPDVIKVLVAKSSIHDEVRQELIKVATHGEVRTKMVWREDLVAEDYAMIRETWNEAGQIEALETTNFYNRSSDDDGDERALDKEQRVVLLEQLATSQYDEVRREIALNDATPRHVLQSLTNDESAWVAQTAEQQLFNGERQRDRFSEENSSEVADAYSNDGTDAERAILAERELVARAERDIDVALDQLAGGSRTVRHQVERDLHAAAVIAVRNVDDHVLTSRVPSTVSDLPGFGIIPFRGVQLAQSAIDGARYTVSSNDLGKEAHRRDEYAQPVGKYELQLTARVLSAETSIKQNAEYMGNCTAGYVGDVACGDVRLVGLYDEDGTCHLNVALEHSWTGWRAGEINTRFNGYGFGYHNAPKRVQRIADQLAHRMNNTDK